MGRQTGLPLFNVQTGERCLAAERPSLPRLRSKPPRMAAEQAAPANAVLGLAPSTGVVPPGEGA